MPTKKRYSNLTKPTGKVQLRPSMSYILPKGQWWNYSGSIVKIIIISEYSILNTKMEISSFSGNIMHFLVKVFYSSFCFIYNQQVWREPQLHCRCPVHTSKISDPEPFEWETITTDTLLTSNLWLKSWRLSEPLNWIISQTTGKPNERIWFRIGDTVSSGELHLFLYG
jgi:hypothetical protein